jgi:hypothetical protein
MSNSANAYQTTAFPKIILADLGIVREQPPKPQDTSSPPMGIISRLDRLHILLWLD